MISDILPGVLAECGIDRANPSITENTFEMRQVKALMEAAGRDINNRAEWSRAHAVFTGTSVGTIDLPDDFQELTETGAVTLGSDYTPVRGIVSPELWQMLGRTTSAETYYFLRNGKIHFAPEIGLGGVTVRYISKNWLGDKAAISSNDDTPIFPESLLQRGTVWRWRRQKGLPYDDLIAEFESDLEVAIKADRGVA